MFDIYIPMISNEKITISVDNKKIEIENNNGWLLFSQIKDKINSKLDVFLIQVNDEDFISLNFDKLKNIYNKFELLNAKTCLNTYIDIKGRIQPCDITSNFDVSKENIILFMEFNYLINHMPLNITIYDDEQKCLYSFLEIIPASTNENYHRCFIHILNLRNLRLKHNTSLFIKVYLLDGRMIYNQKIFVICKKGNTNFYNIQKNNFKGVSYDSTV